MRLNKNRKVIFRISLLMISFILFSCNPFAESDVDPIPRVFAFLFNESSKKPTYHVIGTLKDSSGEAVSGASLNVSSGLNTSLQIKSQVQDNGTTIVGEKPDKIAFVDIDPREGYLAGSVTIKKAGDESNISYYNLYWANDNDRKIKRIAHFKKSGLDYTYVFPVGTKPPISATKLLAASEYQQLESDSVTSLRYKDSELQFFTDSEGKYTMGIQPGNYDIGIVSKEGIVLGTVKLEVKDTYNENDEPPAPVLDEGNFTMTVTGIGTGSAPVTEVTYSSTKELIGFTIPVVGAVTTINGTEINIIVPYNTPTSSFSSIAPSFIATGTKVRVSEVDQVSGVSLQDFSNPVNYIVFAQDGTAKEYTVSVTVSPNFAPTASNLTISGTVANGQTLTAGYTYADSNGHTEGTSSFQWYRCSDNTTIGSCSAIAGENRSTYTIQSGDSSYYLRFSVHPVDEYGLAGSMVYSESPGILSSPTVSGLSISGIVANGNVLTASYSFTSPNGYSEGTSNLQWYRCTDNSTTGSCSAIVGANATNYTLQNADEDYYLRFSVVPVDEYNLSGTLTYSLATDKLLIFPVAGNGGALSFSAMASTTSVVLSWTKATDLKTAQTALTYTVYKSTTDNISTVAEMEANGTTAGSGTNISSKALTISSGQKLYFNVLVQDGSGNKTAYNGAQRHGVWVNDYATISGLGGYNSGSSSWEASTGFHPNCPSTENDGECMRSQDTAGTPAKMILVVTYDKPGTIFFAGVRAGGSQTCQFTISGATGVSSSFITDGLYSQNVNAGTNTFTWTDSDPGNLTGNRCFVDRIRY